MFLLYYLLACTEEIPEDFPRLRLAVSDAPEYHRVKGRHILVSYQDAWRSETPRSKKEAQDKIERVREWAMDGYDFGQLARKYSDDPGYTQQGHLGVVEKGDLVSEFEEALFALNYHEISPIVETGFGYHIIQRLPLREAELTHILIQWKSSPNANTTRTKEEALQRCEEVRQALEKDRPANVAVQFSDGPMGSRKGYLGWLEEDDLDPEFAEVIFRLNPGECSSQMEGQQGFHFFCMQNRSP